MKFLKGNTGKNPANGLRFEIADETSKSGFVRISGLVFLIILVTASVKCPGFDVSSGKILENMR